MPMQETWPGLDLSKEERQALEAVVDEYLLLEETSRPGEKGPLPGGAWAAQRLVLRHPGLGATSDLELALETSLEKRREFVRMVLVDLIAAGTVTLRAGDRALVEAWERLYRARDAYHRHSFKAEWDAYQAAHEALVKAGGPDLRNEAQEARDDA